MPKFEVERQIIIEGEKTHSSRSEKKPRPSQDIAAFFTLMIFMALIQGIILIVIMMKTTN